AAEPSHGVGHHFFHRARVGNIAHAGERGATVRLDFADDRAGLILVRADIHDDGGAARRQFQRDGTADVAARAGDDGHAPVKLLAVHASPRRVLRSTGPSNNVRASASTESMRPSGQPPWRALSRNFSWMSWRVSGSWAPPRRCGWRSSTTAPSRKIAR